MSAGRHDSQAAQLKSLIVANEIEDVIIAMPSADGKAIRAIVDSCKNANVTFKTLPSIGKLIDCTLTISQIKGEKLFEELLIDGEGVLPTAHNKIKVLAPVHIDLQPVRDELDRLYDAARSNSVHELMESLKRLVPEFKPSYSFIGEAPLTFQRVRPDLFPHP